MSPGSSTSSLQGQSCFTRFCLGRGRVPGAGAALVSWRQGDWAVQGVPAQLVPQQNHGVNKSVSARGQVLSLSVGSRHLAPGNSDPKTAGYKSSPHGMLWASKTSLAQWKKKKKRFDFILLPRCYCGFLGIVRGFASDGGDGNTEMAPCLGTSHLTKEGRTPLPNHRTPKLLQLRLSGSVYCFPHLKCALICHL